MKIGEAANIVNYLVKTTCFHWLSVRVLLRIFFASVRQHDRWTDQTIKGRIKIERAVDLRFSVLSDTKDLVPVLVYSISEMIKEYGVHPSTFSSTL